MSERPRFTIEQAQWVADELASVTRELAEARALLHENAEARDEVRALSGALGQAVQDAAEARRLLVRGASRCNCPAGDCDWCTDVCAFLDPRPARDEARRCTCAVIGVEYRASTGERIGELHLPWCPARDEGKP